MNISATNTPRNLKKRGVNTTFTFDLNSQFANNDEYASKGLVFDIVAISYEPGKGYEGSDRWALSVKPKDREVETMTLGSNLRRDEQLRAVQAFIDRQGSVTNVRLEKSRNAYYFENAAVV